MPDKPVSLFELLAHKLTPQPTRALFGGRWPSARYPGFELLEDETVEWLPEPMIIGRYPGGNGLQVVGITNLYGPYVHDSLLVLLETPQGLIPDRFGRAIRMTNGGLIRTLEPDREAFAWLAVRFRASALELLPARQQRKKH